VRRWSHLERQTGGAGVRGGPGEKQIELDRRMIDDSIKRTRERLVKVKRQRATQRRQRERRGTFNISLVGYTNAGKSTLFNALVKARAYAANQLFATLDTTTRQLYLADRKRRHRSVSLSDTVGFIRDLPHGLIDAFQATLQEAVDADLLLHVVDAANPHHPEQIEEVQRVLHEIGADGVPQLLVFNKTDALEPERSSRAAGRLASSSRACRCRACSSAARPAPACRSCGSELARILAARQPDPRAGATSPDLRLIGHNAAADNKSTDE
jgi:GTP-binding protein HflX